MNVGVSVLCLSDYRLLCRARVSYVFRRRANSSVASYLCLLSDGLFLVMYSRMREEVGSTKAVAEPFCFM